jgi:hypothetical protein
VQRPDSRWVILGAMAALVVLAVVDRVVGLGDKAIVVALAVVLSAWRLTGYGEGVHG